MPLLVDRSLEELIIAETYLALKAKARPTVAIERLSFSDYIAQAWHVVEPATPHIPNWHIDCIAEHLEAVTSGQLRDFIINIPPRHSKSLCVSVFWPTWVWTQKPQMRWLFASYAETLSVRDSLKCRRLIQSPWYQERWGSVFRLAGDQNLKTRFDNDRSGYRIASSVGGSNTGEGGDCIVCDDPHNVFEAESDLVREGVLTWWDEVMSTRRNSPTSARVIIMQRVHEDDLTGHLLARGGYHHLCLPARYEPKVYVEGVRTEHVEAQPHTDCEISSDPRTEDGELLWPDRFDETALAELERDLGPYAAAGQLQQRPVPREGALFHSDWFKPLPDDFDTPDEKGQTLRQRLQFVQYWDLAFSEKASADYTAAVTVGVDEAQNIYIVNVHRERVDEAALDTVMADHIGQTRPQLVGVEEGAYKQAATKDLIRRLNKSLGGRWAVGVVAVKVTTDKVFRAQLPAGRAKIGQVYADRQAHWWAAFEQELLKFPKGAHDDQVDALSGACQLAVERIRIEQPGRTQYGMSGRPEKKEGWRW